MPVEQISSTGQVDYLAQDALGSTRLITDSSGAVVGTTSYSPYGQVTAQSGTVTTPFGFAGDYTDPLSGLVYMQARWYDPATGQFLSQDPLWPVLTEPYVYVEDNPLNAVDPSGLCGTPQCTLARYDLLHYGTNLGCIPRSWGPLQEGEAIATMGASLAGGEELLGVTGVRAWLEFGSVSSLAAEATVNPDSEAVILGKYPTYSQIGARQGYTYFNYDDWNAYPQPWRVNRAFLVQQAAAGKTFLITNEEQTGSFAREVGWLASHGISYQMYGP